MPWHDADGAERNKTLPRGPTRRDAEAFERRVYTLKRAGELDVLDRGRETIGEEVITRFRLVLKRAGTGRATVRKPRSMLQGMLARAVDWQRITSTPVAVVVGYQSESGPR